MRKAFFLLLLCTLVLSAALAGCAQQNGGNGASQAGDGASAAKPAQQQPSGEEASGKEASGEQPKEPVTLRIAWWGSQERHDATIKVIDLFKAKYPHVTVETEFAGYGGYWEKLAVQSAGNDLPDVIQTDVVTIIQYANKNLLADLTEWVDSRTIDVSGIDSSIVDSGKVGDNLYGISLGTNALGIIYNPETLKKAGVSEINPNWSWAEFEQTVLGMKQALGDGNFGGGAVWAEDFGYYLRTFGQTLFSADGKSLGYDDDQYFIDFIGMNKRLIDAKAVPSSQDYATVKGLEDEFVVRGTAPFVELWSNAVVALSAAAKQDLKLTFLPGGDVPGHYLKPAMFFSVTENSKAKEESALFIDFVTNDIEANKILMAERGVPVSSKVTEGLLPLLNPSQKELFDYVDRVAGNSRPMDPPDPTGATEVIGAMSSISEQIYFDKITVEEGAKEFRKQATDILNRP